MLLLFLKQTKKCFQSWIETTLRNCTIMCESRDQEEWSFMPKVWIRSRLKIKINLCLTDNYGIKLLPLGPTTSCNFTSSLRTNSGVKQEHKQMSTPSDSIHLSLSLLVRRECNAWMQLYVSTTSRSALPLSAAEIQKVFFCSLNNFTAQNSLAFPFFPPPVPSQPPLRLSNKHYSIVLPGNEQ